MLRVESLMLNVDSFRRRECCMFNENLSTIFYADNKREIQR